MMRTSGLKALLAVALGAAATSLGTVARAQTASPAATQVSPSAYVVSGWRVECGSAGGALACQALDQVTARANNSVIVSVSVSLGADGKTPYVLLQTPLGVAVDTPIRLTTPNGANQALPFLTCAAEGCFARAPLADPLLSAMRTTGQTLTVIYAGLNAGGAKQNITTTLALDGFTAAYAKLH